MDNLPATLDEQVARDDREIGAAVLRDEGGMFLPGVSGNPTGRPKGTKNHLTELNRQLEIAVRENINPRAVRKLIERIMELALAGNMKAAKLLLDKVLANATSAGDEDGEKGGTFVFQVKNLTLKADQNTQPVVTVEAHPIIDVTPQEIKQ